MGPGVPGAPRSRSSSLARLGAVLVDADEVAPAVAPRLALALEPNVRGAIDAIEFGMGDVRDSIQAVDGLAGGALCGAPNASAWLQVRPSELARVLHALATTAPVVVDTSPLLDDVGAAIRGRYALTRAIVAEANMLVVVGLATPVGVVRLLAWLADAQRLRPALPVYLVLNRVRGAAFRRAELAHELLRSYRPAAFAQVPDDERVRAAGWDGALVARGPFTRAVADVAASLEHAVGTGVVEAAS